MEDQEQYGMDRGEQMLVDLITAMQEQTKAITSLVECVDRLAMIVAAQAMDDMDADESLSTYLDGTPK